MFLVFMNCFLGFTIVFRVENREKNQVCSSPSLTTKKGEMSMSTTPANWNPGQLTTLGFEHDEIRHAVAMAAQRPHTLVTDLLVDRRWPRGVPASDQYQVYDLRQRELSHLTMQGRALHSRL
jgi:hypothetical protein